MIDKRLKELRKEKKLLQKNVAKYLNISTSAYGYYEQGKRNIDAETIKKLADFFECSADYLLGRTNNKNNNYNIISKSDLYQYDSNYINYKKAEKKIIQRLSDEELIKNNEPITQYIFDKILKYGLETAIEILKLKKKLEET